MHPSWVPSVTLRIDASDDDMLALKQALQLLSQRAPKPFASLFSPSERHVPTPVDDSIAIILLHFDLVEKLTPGVWASRHRVRVIGDRFYVMEIGVEEYHQDLWPETDALLEVLEALPAKGRLLDLGTGSGVVAIEAAHRGHEVVATDLYQSALDLARFNARLNGFPELEMRLGDLYDPVAGEHFDTILTAPHYTRVGDQVRHRALRDGPDRLAPDGELVVATFLEWQGPPDAPIATVEVLLRPRTDCTIHIAPIVSPTKVHWFAHAAADGGADLGPLVSRQRFLVRIRRRPGPIEIVRPVKPRTTTFIPLSRLTVGLDGAMSPHRQPPMAVLRGPEDLERVRQLLAQIADGVVSISGTVPGDLLDACRLGKGTCVSFTDRNGAAGAILSLDGTVRPCVHGGAIGTVDDSLEELVQKQRTLAEATQLRRGCVSCSAAAHCSRCLFPAVLDEAGYCNLVRSAGPSWPLLARVWDLVEQLDRMRVIGRRLRIKLRPGPALLAARGRSMPEAPGIDAEPELAAMLATLRTRMQTTSAWLVSVDGARFFSYYFAGGKPWILRMERAEAALAELCAEGAGPAELDGWARTEFLPPSVYRHTLLRVYDLFS